MFKWNETIQEIQEMQENAGTGCSGMKNCHDKTFNKNDPDCRLCLDDMFQATQIELNHLKKEKYKSFRQQMKECTENGNLIHVDTLPMKKLYGHEVGVILVCVKNKCICSSKVCKNERIK